MKHLLLGLIAISTSATELAAADKKAAPQPDFASFEWPVETGTYKPGPGVELAQGLCITCHSTEYVSSQPPLPRKFWEATVKKMKEKYGAPMPENSAALVDYLTSVYGTKD